MYRLLADHSRDVIIGLDATSYVRYVSPSIYAMLGYLPHELLRQPWHELPFNRFDGETSILNCDDVSQTFQAIHKDGNKIWIETSINSVPNGSAIDDIHCVVQLRNVSARKEVEFQLQRANAELAQHATVDSLTTLSNRRMLVSTLEKEWKRARRDGSPLSILMFDIDNFKIINDRFGHQAGDECLIKVAAMLKKNCRRPADLCARYGGEEFIIVLPNTEQNQAQQIAERILLQMRQISIDSIQDHTFSISIGLATTLPAIEGEGWSDLIHAADEALYTAKRTGKDRLVVATSPASEVIVLQ